MQKQCAFVSVDKYINQKMVCTEVSYHKHNVQQVHSFLEINKDNWKFSPKIFLEKQSL